MVKKRGASARHLVHLSRGRAEVNAEHLHASDDSQSRLQDVTVDDRSKLHLLLFCVTTLMKNPVGEQRKVIQLCRWSFTD